MSTRDQSPALQLNALREAGCERVFMEKASGAQRERPELKAALDYLRAGDTLAVWKLDRLARSVRQLVETAEDLAKREIGLRVLTQAIDTTSPGGRLVFHVFAAVAEFERELTLERTHAGLAQAKALGRRGGRKPAMGPAEIKRAKAMLADPTITVEEVAQQIGVRRTQRRHSATNLSGFQLIKTAKVLQDLDQRQKRLPVAVRAMVQQPLPFLDLLIKLLHPAPMLLQLLAISPAMSRMPLQLIFQLPDQANLKQHLSR